jgi:transposase IS66 family protein
VREQQDRPFDAKPSCENIFEEVRLPLAESVQCLCLAQVLRPGEIFPVSVKFVLDAIGKVYEQEEQRNETGATLESSPEQSGPVMSALKEWMEKHLADREVEPNSELDEALHYSLKHWSGLTQFSSTRGL